MTSKDKLVGEYFEWLHGIVCKNNMPKSMSYRKLLSYLHNVDFRIVVLRDQNRSEDGVDLRYRYAMELEREDKSIDVMSVIDCLAGPCSVLEMMVALAIHCEEDIMDDPTMGDRTGQWFWGMIVNLGLGSMTDDRFDAKYADEVIDRFLDRKYEPDGRGGLFRIRNCHRDLREVEIWWQMCWYLNTIT